MFDLHLWLTAMAFALALGVRPVRRIGEIQSVKLKMMYGDVGLPEAFGAFITRTLWIWAGLSSLKEWL